MWCLAVVRTTYRCCVVRYVYVLYRAVPCRAMLAVLAQSTSSSYSSLCEQSARARVPAECGKLQEQENGVLPTVAGIQDLVVHWVHWVHWVHCPCRRTETLQRGGAVRRCDECLERGLTTSTAKRKGVKNITLACYFWPQM